MTSSQVTIIDQVGSDEQDTARLISKLKEERERMETVLDSMSDGIFTVDGMGRLRMFNPPAARMLGLTPGLLKRPLAEALPFEPLLELVASQGTEEEEPLTSVEFELPGHPTYTVLARRSPLKDPGGVLVVLSDVTEMRRLETIRRDFVANVSHELRTPISVIQANAETLLDGAMEDPKSGRSFVEAMLRNAERLSSIIADLLDLSRIEARRYPVKLEPIVLATVVNRMLDALAQKVTERDLSFKVKIPSDLCTLADVKALEQVMQNLLDNAAKYTPEQGHIEISASRRGSMVRLTVSNNGPPIKPEHRSRIFERFYRIDPGRSRDMGGTGLGLAIVKHLVETMHGRVGVSSGEKIGTTFWVHLPAV